MISVRRSGSCVIFCKVFQRPWNVHVCCCYRTRYLWPMSLTRWRDGTSRLRSISGFKGFTFSLLKPCFSDPLWRRQYLKLTCTTELGISIRWCILSLKLLTCLGRVVLSSRSLGPLVYFCIYFIFYIPWFAEHWTLYETLRPCRERLSWIK